MVKMEIRGAIGLGFACDLLSCYAHCMYSTCTTGNRIKKMNLSILKYYSFTEKRYFDQEKHHSH